MKKRMVLATVLIVYPIVFLIISFIGYILGIFLASSGVIESDVAAANFQFTFNVIGIISLIGFPIAMPIGIFLMVKNMRDEEDHPENRSQTIA